MQDQGLVPSSPNRKGKKAHYASKRKGPNPHATSNASMSSFFTCNAGWLMDYSRWKQPPRNQWRRGYRRHNLSLASNFLDD